MVIRSLTLAKRLQGCISLTLTHNVTRNFSISSAVKMSADPMDKFKLPARYAGSEASVWIEYIDLYLKYKPLNLGQGFADYSPPKYVLDALNEVSNSDNFLLHQYTRGFGHPRIIAAISTLYSKLIGREINPQKEVLVTYGAYEALFCSIVGHVEVGDEVIIIEPFFDCYEPMVKSAGGVPKYIPLRLKKQSTDSLPTSRDWVLDEKELEGMFNSKTKMIIVNSPQNPLGKVFTEEELTLIANLCKKWNVLCLSDEVYEWHVYKPNKHIRMATLPGMWERTITIGSAGKSFSATGWKLGWVYCPANLMFNLQMVHQNCVYTGCTPIQEAVAICFEKELSRLGQPESYFESLSEELRPKRDFICKALTDLGMKPTVPEGGYFIIADWSPLESKANLSSEKDKYKDYRFTKWMTKEVGLQGIPPTAFYSEPHKSLAEHYVRYCFFKKDETLQQAAEILKKWKSQM